MTQTRPQNQSPDTPQTQRQITGLIDAMMFEFTEHMMPALPADQNYRAAMMKRGLEILAAHVRTDHTDHTGPRFSIPSQGDFSQTELADALRSRRLAGSASDDLHKQLAEDVDHRRRLANPKAKIKTSGTSAPK